MKSCVYQAARRHISGRIFVNILRLQVILNIKVDIGSIVNAEHYDFFCKLFGSNTREMSARIWQGVYGNAAVCAHARRIRGIRLSLDISGSSDELNLSPGNASLLLRSDSVTEGLSFLKHYVLTREPMNRKGLSHSDASVTVKCDVNINSLLEHPVTPLNIILQRVPVKNL